MKNINDIKLENFPFQHTIKTRWRDLDAFRHVNNATFLSYIEDARILFFKRTISVFLFSGKLILSVVSDVALLM